MSKVNWMAWKGKQSIRVHFLDDTFKAVSIQSSTTAADLHKIVVEKIELVNDSNFGLYDKRKDSGRCKSAAD